MYVYIYIFSTWTGSARLGDTSNAMEAADLARSQKGLWSQVSTTGPFEDGPLPCVMWFNGIMY